MAERIVLFGGTFDPVHHGHLIVARAVAEELGVARIVLVPAAVPPHKRGASAAPEDRLAMLRLAVGDEGLFEVCDWELCRPGPSYTFDTLSEFRRRRGRQADLHWVVGMDMLADLPLWHRAGEVLALARIIVAARPPWQGRLEEVLASLEGRLEAEQIGELRRRVVSTPLIEISSTDIRRRVLEGRSVRYLVPDPVGQYIHEHGLYRGGPNRQKNADFAGLSS